jgi:hypothetical protein
LLLIQIEKGREKKKKRATDHHPGCLVMFCCGAGHGSLFIIFPAEPIASAVFIYLPSPPPPLPADLLKQKAPDALQSFKSRKKKWLFTGRGDVHF